MRRKDYRTAFRLAMAANVLLVLTAFAFLTMYLKADRQLRNADADSEGTVKIADTAVGSAYDDKLNDYLSEEEEDPAASVTGAATTASATTEETTTAASRKSTKVTTAAAGGGNTAATTKTTTAAPTTTTKTTTKPTQPASPTQYNDNDGDWVNGWD